MVFVAGTGAFVQEGMMGVIMSAEVTKELYDDDAHVDKYLGEATDLHE